MYRIFPYYLIKSTIFGKHFLNIKRVFLFSPKLLSETFLTFRRNERDVIINWHRSTCKVSVILILFERNLNFLGSSEMYSNIKFHENPSPVSRVQRERTDRQDEANIRFLHFFWTHLRTGLLQYRPITFFCWLRFRYVDSIHQANFDDFLQNFRRCKVVLIRFYQILLLRGENWKCKETAAKMRWEEATKSTRRKKKEAI